mmetsp:Transcript_8062/g.20049  ORF Transcript_8062/g.20049 Transcript_8062/m.20049 type:complete len:295 (+) Transcript_8062:255-1139(+)
MERTGGSVGTRLCVGIAGGREVRPGVGGARRQLLGDTFFSKPRGIRRTSHHAGENDGLHAVRRNQRQVVASRPWRCGAFAPAVSGVAPRQESPVAGDPERGTVLVQTGQIEGRLFQNEHTLSNGACGVHAERLALFPQAQSVYGQRRRGSVLRKRPTPHHFRVQTLPGKGNRGQESEELWAGRRRTAHPRGPARCRQPQAQTRDHDDGHFCHAGPVGKHVVQLGFTSLQRPGCHRGARERPLQAVVGGALVCRVCYWPGRREGEDCCRDRGRIERVHRGHPHHRRECGVPPRPP